MTCRASRILLMAIIFVIGSDAKSQSYPYVHYTPKDGLVSSRVKKVYQDSKGRIYFLTFGGLSVYDGVRFRNYTVQNGLPNNVINDILEIGNDSLLVATNSGNLNLLVKGTLETVKTANSACPVINQFYRHDDNRIYLSSDNGLFLLEKNKIYSLNISRLTENQTTPPFLGGITGVGNFLIITTDEMRFNKGIYVYDIKMNRICDALPIGGSLLGKDQKNRIWISTSDKLNIIDQNALQKGKLSLIVPSGGYQQIKDYSTTNVDFDTDAIWVVFRNQEFRNTEIQRITEKGAVFSIPLPEQAKISNISNIFIDRETTIWLGNSGEGVFKITNSPLQIFENPLGKSMESQAGNAFYSEGITWYGTTTKKLFRKSGDKLEEFNCNLAFAPAVFHERGNKIFANDAKNIYEGFFRSAKRIIEFKKIISLPDSDFFIKRIVVDKNGAIISGQRRGVSVWLNKKMIYHLPIDNNEVVEELFFDRNDLLWVVKRSRETNVFQLHPENPSQYLQPVFRFEKEQIVGSPRSFLIDKRGIIWIGTRDNGITGYRQKDSYFNKLYHFDSGNGLAENFVTALACDSSNNIIVGTQTGVDRILFDSLTSYRVENLSKSSNFFGFISQVWADAKQAYALTNTGVLLQVSSAAETKKNNPPQLLLEEVRVNAQSVKERPIFNYKENNISFLVAAPSFIDEKQVAYAYLLEGSGNKQWSDTASTNAVINLTNLSAGKYVLKVKAFFHSTSYSPTELSYSFEITPPWWQTWWLKTIVGLLIIVVLIIGFRFYYNRRLEKQMAVSEKQQAIERERTRIATDMHDDLGAGLSRIRFLSQSILNKKIKDDGIKTELEKITSFSDEMSEKMGEIVWALNEKNDTLADLVAYTRSYAVEYLATHDIQCEANTPLNLPGTFITGEIRRNIFLSVKECLHNIVKHAGATKVCLTVQLDHEMKIVIHDNGKGIDWNNRRAFSNGLENINKRMKEINGEVDFANEHGTRVSLSIPFL
jgi:signal transduction histidine kinase/ligand-binding sensor domain-containing protein